MDGCHSNLDTFEVVRNKILETKTPENKFKNKRILNKILLSNFNINKNKRNSNIYSDDIIFISSIGHKERKDKYKNFYYNFRKIREEINLNTNRNFLSDVHIKINNNFNNNDDNDSILYENNHKYIKEADRLISGIKLYKEKIKQKYENCFFGYNSTKNKKNRKFSVGLENKRQVDNDYIDPYSHRENYGEKLKDINRIIRNSNLNKNESYSKISKYYLNKIKNDESFLVSDKRKSFSPKCRADNSIKFIF